MAISAPGFTPHIMEIAGRTPQPRSSSPPPDNHTLDDLLVIEQSFFRHPLYVLRTHLKNQQRLCERELSYCCGVVDDMLKRIAPVNERDTNKRSRVSQRGTLAVASAVARLDSLIDKLSSIAYSSQTYLTALKERCDSLLHMYKQEHGSHAFSEWCAVRLDRLLVDYTLRMGWHNSAKILADAKGISTLVDINDFEQIGRIERSLCPPDGIPSCTEALAWCSEHKVGLRKTHSTLEFELRLQEFIEMVRSRKPNAAIEYAKENFAHWIQLPHDDSTKSTSAVVDKALQAMGLLACGSSSWLYHDLFNEERWRTLAQAFRECALQLYDLPQVPLLCTVLSAGLSSLKTRECYGTNDLHNGTDANTNCAVCYAGGLDALAGTLPRNHRERSVLICRISGKIMDDKNPPLCLPNGQVYSKEALEEMAKQSSDGKTVVCMRTGKVFSLSSCKRMYIM